MSDKKRDYTLTFKSRSTVSQFDWLSNFAFFVAVTNFLEVSLQSAETLETNRPVRKRQPGGVETLGGPTAIAAGGGVRGVGGETGDDVGIADGAKKAGQKASRKNEGEPKGIPAKFLQAISAGLSTSLDPKVNFSRGSSLASTTATGFCTVCYVFATPYVDTNSD